MTWSLARNQLVAMLEGVTRSTMVGNTSELTHTGDFGKHFKQGKELWPGLPAKDPRSFYVRGVSGATRIGHHFQNAERTRTDVEVGIWYPIKKARLDQFDEAINGDYEAVRRVLVRPANWNRPSSTIIHVIPAGDDLLTYDTELVEEDNSLVGGWLYLRFTLEHTAQTS